MTKTCLICGLEKPPSDFYRSKAAKDGLFSYCKSCAKAKTALWRKENPEKVLAQAERRILSPEEVERNRIRRSKRYYANREQEIARNKAYAAANASVIKEKKAAYLSRPEVSASSKKYMAEYRKSNRAALLVAKRVHYEKNSEKYKARASEYQRTHPEMKKAIAHNRRSADGRITKEDISFLFCSQRGLCPVCRSNLLDGYHVDHVVPIVSGGSNHRGNLQLLCPTCNLQKSSKDPIDFMQQKGFLL